MHSFGFTLDSWTDLLLLLLLAAALATVAWLSVARPWRSWPAGPTERLMIGTALVRYEFWLELRGVNRRRRRDLTEELRANLLDAAARVGARPAITALGSLRRMSAEAAEASPARPRWSTGIAVAGGAFLFVTLVELVAIAAWISAAEASGANRVQGSLPFFPGSQASWERIGSDGLSISLAPGWLILAAAVIAFLVASRPWLALTSRSRSAMA